MCINLIPLHKTGKYKESTYKGEKGEFYEINTFQKCGNCPQCVAEKANNWVIRNHYESKAHKEICFITLTYKENPYILIKKDLQDFIKRLRRKIKKKIRVFTNGEYGTLSNRPHYHIIIYGWTEKNPVYMGLNKKKNLIYKSELIEKTWGLGLTSYQQFNDREIAYISLYNTMKEKGVKEYKSNIENAKSLIERLKKEKCIERRAIIIKEFNRLIKQAEKNKEKYIKVKEFNTWSKALGWKEFYKEYKKHDNYNFKEYIKDTEFVTPTPWVKKLANMGDKNAIKEMLLRTQELTASINKYVIAREKNLKKLDYEIKENLKKIEWTETQKEIEI